MTAGKAILLLGRRDEPTDGVADYCEMLREAALRRGLSFEIAQVPWAEKGWDAALAELRSAAAAWRDRWVFLQFTTLAWSRRGFPLRAPRLLDILEECGARPGVVFHDIMPLRGSGLVGRAREYCHLHVLRQLYARSKLSVFTVSVDKIDWLPPKHEKAVFIPVGSNFPQVDRKMEVDEDLPSGDFTIAVFGITDGTRGAEEVEDIAYALKRAQQKRPQLRLMAIGRGSADFEGALRTSLNGSGVELSVFGLMPARDLAQALAGAQLLLCVRGHVSSRRGSAIAGILCGLPIVGYRGPETDFPVTEAGIKLVEMRDREGLAEALSQVLTNAALYREMHLRSMGAARKYFSWDAIASQFVNAMSVR
jgi:glycosyltransferase involved in cell wall biosynthesis